MSMTERGIIELWAVLDAAQYRSALDPSHQMRSWLHAFAGVANHHVSSAVQLWIADHEARHGQSLPFPSTWDVAEYLDTDQHRRPPLPDEEWHAPTGTPLILEYDSESQTQIDVTPIRWSTFRRIWEGERAHLANGCMSAWIDKRDGKRAECYRALRITPWTVRHWPHPPYLETTPIGADRECGAFCSIRSGRQFEAVDQIRAQIAAR